MGGIQAVLLNCKSGSGLITLGKSDGKQLLVLLVFPMKVLIFMADEQGFFNKYWDSAGHGAEHWLEAGTESSPQ